MGAAVLSAGCGPPPAAVDLIATARTSLLEASAAGHDASWVRERVGRSVKVGDVARDSLPAGPPSRLVLSVRVPKGGRLMLAVGVPPAHQTQPAVDFTVSVRHGGAETRVATRQLDPAQRPEDRGWVPLEADLSSHEGPAELVLETSGPPRPESGAAWGNPVIARPADRKAPLVIVYLVDTLRRDHLSLYGYGRRTSPSLDGFASDAVVFDQAIAPSSWTIPSVASLFTSLLPDGHGALHLQAPLAPAAHTLAERMAESGFATGAVVANPLILASSGFDQGFGYFEGLHGRKGRLSTTVPAARVVDAALRFIDSHRGLASFLFVHAFDPHSPYQPPPPFDRQFEPPTTSERDQAIALYDGEIAYGDQEFGRFVRELKARGLYDRALFVFASDHGEEFLDHGDWRHGTTLFDELVRVPLVVRFPGGAHSGRRVGRQVQLLDVLPTVLRTLSLPVPVDGSVLGHPLQEAISNELAPPPALLQLNHRGHVAYAARTQQEKVVHGFSPVDGVHDYDLVRDPEERSPKEVTGGRAAELLQLVEAAMAPSGHRHHVRVGGNGVYELRLRTNGTVVDVDAAQLGGREFSRLDARRQELTLSLRPRPGLPREVSLRLKPHGAPLWIDGTHDGRPLRAGDIHVGSRGKASGAVPLAFPVVEHSPGVFDPTPAGPWVGVWITRATAGPDAVPLDDDVREQLRTLGYVGN
jgi:arylsulfatase A-like enzyme